jgi:hypothetical protein
MRAELNPDRRSVRVEVGWFLGYLDHVQVVYMDGRVDDSSYARYVDCVVDDIDARQASGKRVAVFYHVPQPSALTAKRRTMLGKVLAERSTFLGDNTIAYSMATSSVAVRSGLRVLFWLAPPPYPNAVVAAPRAGFDFLAQYDASLNPTELTARYDDWLRELMPRMDPSSFGRGPRTDP